MLAHPRLHRFFTGFFTGSPAITTSTPSPLRVVHSRRQSQHPYSLSHICSPVTDLGSQDATPLTCKPFETKKNVNFIHFALQCTDIDRRPSHCHTAAVASHPTTVTADPPFQLPP